MTVCVSIYSNTNLTYEAWVCGAGAGVGLGVGAGVGLGVGAGVGAGVGGTYCCCGILNEGDGREGEGAG